MENDYTDIHPLLSDYDIYKKELRSNRIRSDETKEKERIYALAKYYAQKTLKECEICKKSYVYLDRHYLSKGHLSKLENPIEVIKAQFEEVALHSEQNKQEVDKLSESKKELEQALVDSQKKLNTFLEKEVKPLQLSELKRSRRRF